MLDYSELKDAKENEYSYYKKFYVIVTDYLPAFVLGMTDCKGKIWIRRLYGYLKDKVLRHEINHNLFPNESEYEIRRRTSLGLPDLKRFKLIFV